MKDRLIQKPLSVRKSLIEGYGVFAEKDFAQDEVIEECLALMTHNLDPTLNSYYFQAGPDRCIPTGFGCLYNHASDPNASYLFDSEKSLLIFTARRPIVKDEEILVSYGDSWFSKREMPMKKISWWRRFWRFFIGIPLRGLVLVGVVYLIIRLLRDNLAGFTAWLLH